MSDLVHVKDSAMQVLPLCCFDPGNKPMAWTTRAGARAISTCPDCLSDVLSDTCSMCDGSKRIKDYDEEWPCRGCDEEAAQAIINRTEAA